MADLGRLLHPEDRDSLLAAFPPAYPRVVARHVALEGSEEPPDFELPGEAEGWWSAWPTTARACRPS